MFLDMCHDPDIITKVAASIAPKIKGQDDIKMAIACLLFGGSRKVCEGNDSVAPDRES